MTPLDPRVFIMLALGGGKQSGALAHLVADGEVRPFPKEPERKWLWEGGDTPFVAFMADTGWESPETIEYVKRLKKLLPYPIVISDATNDGIKEDHINKGDKRTTMPFFIDKLDGSAPGRVMQKCTSEYKAKVIERWMRRELVGLEFRQRIPKNVEIYQMRGISTDEASRMKPHPWLKMRYPLCMELRMSRNDCVRWLQDRGLEVPIRSACLGCPNRGPDEWMEMKRERPDEFNQVVRWEREFQKVNHGGLDGMPYLHRSLKPIDQVDFDAAKTAGQGDMFPDGCDGGMCGL